DNGASPNGTTDLQTTRKLFTQTEDYSEVDKVPIDQDLFELGDTKRHEAELTLDAFSRYARYFTERATVKFANNTETVDIPGTPDEGISKINVEVRVGGALAAADTDYVIDADLGEITRLNGSTLPLNTDIEIDYVPRPINRWSTETGGGRFPVTFPNTGVPDVLLVDEVLPAFAREQYSEGGDVGVAHNGETIRVWLQRPWFSTGQGELLGVLVGQGATPLSQIARDPLSPTAINGRLELDDVSFFAAATEEGVLGPDVDVAGFEVRFDPDSNRWFSDVTISPSFDTEIGYRPFVKLALCRYQPVSVEGAFVGEHIVTEPIRLGATRNVNTNRSGDDVNVTVTGKELGNEMTAVMQEIDPDIDDADLRWRNVGSEITLTKAVGASESTWTGTLPLPPSGSAARLVIEDAEQLSRGPNTAPTISYVEALELPWTADGGTTTTSSTTTTTTTTTTVAPSTTEAQPGPEAIGDLQGRSGHRAALLRWSPPADNGSAITGYRLERRVGAGAWGSAV
ncbi:MAG: fibronectin type III domain-containing protein, partial [Actinomycetota bacterium]